MACAPKSGRTQSLRPLRLNDRDASHAAATRGTVMTHPCDTPAEASWCARARSQPRCQSEPTGRYIGRKEPAEARCMQAAFCSDRRSARGYAGGDGSSDDLQVHNGRRHRLPGHRLALAPAPASNRASCLWMPPTPPRPRGAQQIRAEGAFMRAEMDAVPNAEHEGCPQTHRRKR